MKKTTKTQKTATDPVGIFYANLKMRFFKGLDYLSLFLYVIVVSVGALVADYLLLLAVEQTVASAISKYPVVAQAFDWFQIGSAFLVFVGATVHAVFSLWSQVRFEVEQTKGAS